MKHYFRLLAFITLISLAIAGCGLVEKQAPKAKVIDGKEVVAVVNEDYVLKSDFDMQVNQVKDALEANGQDFSSKEGQKKLEDIKQTVLDGMIKDVLALQQAEKNNIKLEENEVEQAISQLETYHGGKEALDNHLKEQGIDREKLKEILEDQLLILHLKDELTKDVKVTDEEVKKYYEENKDKFVLPSPQVRASHILVDTEEEAKKILEQINAGKDFAELAKQYSKDTQTKDAGGDLGYFGKGQMEEEFEKAAFKLKPNEISDIVKTKYGFHILKVTDQRDSLSFEDVKTYISAELEKIKKDEKLDEYYDEWMKESKIEKYI
ncbi:MAG TPA: peptidylprolyl isomerase [Thermoanaerobacterales bacterium]|jgi:foldase protein PrsA|nr:peptidylprolyl isomerase [Thermoanaerobacterales bacterium]